MPFEVPPQTFACTSCPWTKTTPDRVGDCRIEGVDGFLRCPQCGGAVASRAATRFEVVVARLEALAQRGWGRRS